VVGEGRRALVPELRRSRVGDRQTGAPLDEDALTGAGARGCGGDGESSLGECVACLAIHVQNTDCPAIDHAALRWL